MGKILIIEGHEGSADAESHALGSAGHQVQSTSRWDKAKRLISDKNLNLIFLEHGATGRDGVNILREIKKIDPIVGVVLLGTGYDAALAEMALDNGAVNYVVRVESTPKTVCQTAKNLLSQQQFQPKLDEQLEELVRERTAELRAANQELEREIRKREKQEAALSDSQKLLQTILDTIPSRVSVKDREGRYLYLNNKVEQDFNSTAEEILGKRTLDISAIAENVREEISRQDQLVLSSGREAKYSEVAYEFNGTLRYYDTIRMPLINDKGQVEGLVAMSQDVTDRREAEERRRILAAAVEQAGEAIMVTDAEGVIQYVNPAFERSSEYTKSETVGRTPSFLHGGSHGPDFYKELWATISAGNSWHGRFINRAKGGGRFKEKATISPIMDPDGVITGYIAVKRDITQESLLESQLKQAQKLEAIGTLASGIAHDLNNILTPIMGYTELLAQSFGEHNEEEYDYSTKIYESSRRACDLVGQILSFSRKQDTAERSSLLLGPFVNDVLKLLRSTIPKNIEIQGVLEPDSGAVLGNPAELQSLLMNLCINAGHAMPDGGVLSVSADQIELDGFKVLSGSRLSGRYIKLSVADTGMGMDSDVLQKIFDPFFTTKEAGKATGLGLYTVYTIANNLGGGLIVDSGLGRGTVFDVYLPTFTGDTSSEDDWQEKVTPMGDENILWVDDEVGILDLGETLLGRWGYRVTVAGGAEEALEIFAETPEDFDLIVSDMLMPSMDGRRLGERIKKIRPDIPIILCSGNAIPAIPGDEGDLFATVIEKPFSAETLSQTVRSILDSSSA